MKIFVFYKDHLALIKDDQVFRIVFDQIFTSLVASQTCAAQDKEKAFSTFTFSHSQNLQFLMLYTFNKWIFYFIFFLIVSLISKFICFICIFFNFHVRCNCILNLYLRLLIESGQVFSMNALVFRFFRQHITITLDIAQNILLFRLFLGWFVFFFRGTLFSSPSIEFFSLFCFQRLFFQVIIRFTVLLFLLFLILAIKFFIKVCDHLLHIDKVFDWLPCGI